MLMHGVPRLQVFVKARLEVIEPRQQQPPDEEHRMGSSDNMISTAQFECYQTILKDNNTRGKGKRLV